MSTRASVLVIDDEPGIRDMLSFELSQEGFDVETAENGMAAVETLRRRKFDLAITDLKMPGMDGVATVEALRALDPDIEVIVATGYASVETAVACMKHGAYDYIQKPYDVAELKLLLERARQKSHLQSVVALYEASRALMTTLKHTDLVQLVVTLAQRVLRADDIGLILWRGEPGDFHIHRLVHDVLPSETLLLALAGRVTQKEGALKLAAHEIQPLASPSENRIYSSALAYPLVARDRALGALVALRRGNSLEFAASELQKGTVFASQLAISLDNARLYDELAQKVSELVRTREQLVHAEKMGLAGQLAGAVAHEVNNPLSFVQANLSAMNDYSLMVNGMWLASKEAAHYLYGQNRPESQAFADMLLTPAGTQGRTESLIREIDEVVTDTLDGVKRIAELVSGFARLAEPQTSASPEPVDVNDIVQECLETLPEESGPDAWEVHFHPTSCLALIAREDLKFALLHMMTFLRAPTGGQARQACTLVLQTGTSEGQPWLEILNRDLLLTEEERRRIFDPRVELDSGGRTMRLNIALALTYQMLRRNDAEVSTMLEQEQGVLFRVLFKPPTRWM
ncbi:response regulator [Stigmatella sp. ncwal1]|uniref:Response regulator n=1 Tax=Stigmatella ashevillensis TaxID=2995309 RepID=A0ABT5DA94_9BACT|nr:response regulator [Stigmatella ashevillena]MDC0710588.1 response regulator [Stigmatella ashevillena]